MVASGSCGQPAAVPKPSPASLTLSSSSPRAHALLALSGTQIQLSLHSIENASGQAVGIRVRALVCPAQDGTDFDLGLVSPYPANRIGTFTLELPSEAAAKLKACAGAVSVEMTLVPIRETEALQDGTTIVATVRSG